MPILIRLEEFVVSLYESEVESETLKLGARLQRVPDVPLPTEGDLGEKPTRVTNPIRISIPSKLLEPLCMSSS